MSQRVQNPLHRIITLGYVKRVGLQSLNSSNARRKQGCYASLASDMSTAYAKNPVEISIAFINSCKKHTHFCLFIKFGHNPCPILQYHCLAPSENSLSPVFIPVNTTADNSFSHVSRCTPSFAH